MRCKTVYLYLGYRIFYNFTGRGTVARRVLCASTGLRSIVRDTVKMCK